MLDREKEAKGFTLLEPHLQIRSCELPVHCKAKWHPVGFYDSRQCLNAIFKLINRSRYPKIVTRRGAYNNSHIESQNATSEVTFHQSLDSLCSQKTLSPIFKYDLNVAFIRATVPLSLAGHRTTNLPAVGVSNRKGQAPIGVSIWRLVHPLSTITRRAYIHGTVIN